MSNHQITSADVEKRLSLLRKVGAVAFAGLMLFGVIVGGKALVDARALLSDSTAVNAEVVDKEIEIRRGSKGRRVTDHMVMYSFVAPDGRQVVDRYETNEAKFDQISVGDALPILVSNADSSLYNRKELAERQASLPGLFKRLTGIVFFGVVMFALIYFLSKRKLDQQVAVSAARQDPPVHQAAA